MGCRILNEQGGSINLFPSYNGRMSVFSVLLDFDEGGDWKNIRCYTSFENNGPESPQNNWVVGPTYKTSNNMFQVDYLPAPSSIEKDRFRIYPLYRERIRPLAMFRKSMLLHRGLFDEPAFIVVLLNEIFCDYWFVQDGTYTRFDDTISRWRAVKFQLLLTRWYLDSQSFSTLSQP